MDLSFITLPFIILYLSAALRVATPILLPAMGEVLSQRAGVFNIGLEGNMLIGAFFGFTISHMTGSYLIGFLAAMIICTAVAYLSALIMVGLNADQIVTGLAINIFAMGLTSAAFRFFYGVGLGERPSAAKLPVAPIPIMEDIPIIGPILFRQVTIVYLALLLVPVFWFILYRTDFGLKIRAVGENPQAAFSKGIDVKQIRYLTIMIAGALAGIGGAHLSISEFGSFFDGMTGGRGFIAIAVVIFGKWNPKGAFIGAILFGLVRALALRLQVVSGIEISVELLTMLPYIVTIVALTIMRGKVAPPSAIGKPFVVE